MMDQEFAYCCQMHFLRPKVGMQQNEVGIIIIVFCVLGLADCGSFFLFFTSTLTLNGFFSEVGFNKRLLIYPADWNGGFNIWLQFFHVFPTDSIWFKVWVEFLYLEWSKLIQIYDFGSFSFPWEKKTPVMWCAQIQVQRSAIGAAKWSQLPTRSFGSWWSVVGTLARWSCETQVLSGERRER